jgi:hypothetical protein
MITAVSRSVFLRPHRRPLSPTNQTASFESQMIPTTPEVLRRTLRHAAGRADRSHGTMSATRGSGPPTSKEAFGLVTLSGPGLLLDRATEDSRCHHPPWPNNGQVAR